MTCRSRRRSAPCRPICRDCCPGRTYLKLRDVGKQLTAHLPKRLDEFITRGVEHARGFWTGGTLFEELGFYYVGPIDGHNLDHLLPVLRNVRDAEAGPILVHVVTQKGKGYAPAETSADKYHGVVKFDVATGAQAKSKSNAPQYTKVFGESLIKEARKDDKIVGDHRSDAIWHRPRPFREGVSQSLLRCRHRRATCGDFCRGSRRRRLQAICCDLFHLPAARL